MASDFDCTILVEDENQLTITYKNAKGVMTEASGKLGTDPIARLTVERMNGWVNYGLAARESYKLNVLEPDDLKVIGLNLFRILFGDEKVATILRDVYKRFTEATTSGVRVQMRLRLAFSDQARELAKLPWEFLYVPNSGDDITQGFFFGEKDQLILARYFDIEKENQDTAQEPGSSRPLKIMVVIYSGFEGMNSISPDHQSLVVNAIKNLAQVETHDNLTYGDLKKKLAEVKPDILHFIGHGEAGKLTLVKAPIDDDYDEGAPDRPQVRWTNAVDFARLFDYAPKPKLVFLQSCKGAQPTAQLTLSCAQELVARGVSAVIAMQHSITTFDAASFAQCFYAELAKEATVDDAVRAGRVELGIRNPPWGHPRFGSPVMYLRRDNILFRRSTADLAAELTLTATAGAASASSVPGAAKPPLPQPSRAPAERPPQAPSSGFGVS